MEVRNISNVLQQLENGEHLSNLELIDYVIQLQLSKIEKYNNAQLKPVHKLTESTEHAMSNLIDLLELRQEVCSKEDDAHAEIIDVSN